MANIIEMLSMSVAERKLHYKADGIDVVKIDGVRFTDYSAFSFLYEKSYIKSPVRSGDGTIGNLNSYATFLTPHLKIDFGLLSIDSYRALMTLIYEKNEFLVECYDVVNNKVETHKMYFSTEEMPKLWTIARAVAGNETYIELLGVQDYTVELIGTNSSLDEVEILYYDENGNLIPEATQTVIKGTEVIIRYNYVPYTNKRFDGVWLDQNNKPILNDTVLKPSVTKKLYVQVEDTNRYKLTLNYGNGIDVSDSLGVAVTTVDISKGETIGDAFKNTQISSDNSYSQDFELVYVYEPPEFSNYNWLYETPISSTDISSKVQLKSIIFNANLEYGGAALTIYGFNANGSVKTPLFKLDDTTVAEINQLFSTHFIPDVEATNVTLEFLDNEILVKFDGAEYSVNYAVGQSLIFDCKDYAYLDVDIYESYAEPYVTVAKATKGSPFIFPANGTGSKVVKVGDKNYAPYEFRGWYWTIEENVGSKVTADTVFDYEINRTLYQIYAPKNFTVHYETNFALLDYDDIQVQYAMSVPLPRPKRDGYTLVGWYTDSAYSNLFSGKMPPYNITLYAKWEVVNQ